MTGSLGNPSSSSSSSISQTTQYQTLPSSNKRTLTDLSPRQAPSKSSTSSWPLENHSETRPASSEASSSQPVNIMSMSPSSKETNHNNWIYNGDHDSAFSHVNTSSDFPSSTQPLKLSNITHTSISKTHKNHKNTSELTVGALGLKNLGNTCYMNSALQCLSNVSPLTLYFASGRWQRELNRDNPLGKGGEVAEAYADVISHVWQAAEPRFPSFAPCDFKGAIGKASSQFLGDSQQDSQELLGFLLDGLHEDLNRIRKKPYTELPDFKDEPDEEVAQKSWDLYLQRNNSIIVDLFQGQYKSRVECTECHGFSIKFDPYMFLSVPVPDRREHTVTVIAVPAARHDNPNAKLQPVKMQVTMAKEATIRTLKQKVSERMKVSNAGMEVIEVYDNKIYKRFIDTDRVDSILANDVLYVFEAGTPDWNLFEASEEERTANNIINVPVYLTFAQHQLCKPFGVPIMISLPSKLRVTGRYIDASSTSLNKSEQRLKILGERLYREVVLGVQRYSLQPLFEKHSCPPSDSYNIQGRSTAAALQTIEASVASQTIDSEMTFIMEPEQTLTGVDKIVQKQQTILPSESPSSHLEIFDSNTAREYQPRANLFKLHIMNQKGFLSPALKENAVLLYPNTSDENPAAPDSINSEGNGAADTDPVKNSDEISIDLKRANPIMLAEWNREIAATIFGNEIFTNFATYAAFDPVHDSSYKSDVPSLNGNGFVQPNSTLEDCLREFAKEEMMGEEDTWYCPACEKHQRSKKKIDLWSVPEILVFHLKRFSNSGGRYYSWRSMGGDKIDSLVDFPTRGLDITNYVVGRNNSSRKPPPRKRRPDEVPVHENKVPLPLPPPSESSSSFSVVPTDSAICDEPMNEFSVTQMERAHYNGLDNIKAVDHRDDETPAREDARPNNEDLWFEDEEEVEDENVNMTDGEDERLIFDLIGVSNHYGGMGGGHYTAYAKNALDGQWYSFDDERVSKINESNVVTPAAYLVFYQRRRRMDSITQRLGQLVERMSKQPPPPEPKHFRASILDSLPLTFHSSYLHKGNSHIMNTSNSSRTCRAPSTYASNTVTLANSPTGPSSPVDSLIDHGRTSLGHVQPPVIDEFTIHDGDNSQNIKGKIKLVNRTEEEVAAINSRVVEEYPSVGSALSSDEAGSQKRKLE